MATLNQMFQPINSGTANTTPATTRKSPLELMIAQQAMAQNADAKTLAGFAFGKLLRGIFDDWKERYDARGLLNRMAEMDPNKRNEMLDYLAQYNPAQHQRMQEYLAKNDGTWADWNNQTQSTPRISNPTTPQTTVPPIQTPQQSEISGFNPNARTVQQTTKKLLGDTDFLNQREVTTDEPWQDDANWNQYKWNSLDDALKSLRNGMGWQNGLRF